MWKSIIPLLLLSSCASYSLRNACEKTNWYNYGKTAAMEGRRLSGDQHVRECLKVEAEVDEVALDHGFKEGMSNYCQPDTVFQIGKRGDFFNGDMCEATKSLTRRHMEGVRSYCQRANGYSSGATGKKYNGVCPKDLEAAFVPEFNRGRKSYLNATIAANEGEIRELEMDVGRLESQKFMWQAQLMALPSTAAPTMVIVTDPYSGQQSSQLGAVDTIAEARRNDLQTQLQGVEYDLSEKRRRSSELRSTNRSLQVEMTTLD